MYNNFETLFNLFCYIVYKEQMKLKNRRRHWRRREMKVVEKKLPMWKVRMLHRPLATRGGGVVLWL